MEKKWRWLGIILGLGGIFFVYSGVVRYLHHPVPDASFLPIGILAMLTCFQIFKGAARESRYWMAMASGAVVVAYGALRLATEKPDEFWAFLIFLGLLIV